MIRTSLAAVASAAVVLASGIAVAQHHGHSSHAHQSRAAPQTDGRALVRFPAALATHTLANMRDHLLALQEISDALSRGDFDKASKTAEARLGMSSLSLHGAHDVARFMPQGMQDAGTAMHRAASRFAIEAQNASVSGDLKPAIGALGQVMSACNACHASYRLK